MSKTVDNPITKAFRKVLDALNLHRPGLGFYALRHCFATKGGAAKDQIAVNHIMGHADDSMAATYREEIDDERLQDVAQYVRSWLLTADRGDEKKPEGGWEIE